MSSDEEDLDCPLCMEELDIADRNFRPCPCGYQICRFCWHHIKTNLNGRCPACRRLYSDQIVEFVPVSAEEIMRLKKEKKEKERQTREMRDPTRRQLSNIRVVQKNLVYVLNVSSKYASPESEIFKKFGKINKVVVSKRTLPIHGAGGGGSTGSTSAVGIYVTFARKEDAAKAIDELNGMEWEGKSIRASYGTTKYCTYYLRHMSCPNPNCMYLHEPGDDVDSYNKDLTCATASATASASVSSSSGIGKHPNSSTSSSTSLNNGFPNKRPATAAKTAATATPETKPTTTPRTWAPIPKVVPITQVPKAEPVQPAQPVSSPATQPAPLAPSIPSPKPPPQQQPQQPQPQQQQQQQQQQPPKQPSPSLASSSKSSNVKKAEKQKKPVIPEEPEKPALPATASWANASPQPVKNVITPSNFGPSLSDALNAPQKPKHTVGRKKEKKSKGKMVRLEEFEEAEREAKMGSKPRMADILMKPAPSESSSSRPQLDTRKGSIKPNEESRKVIVIKDTDMEEAQSEQDKPPVAKDESVVINDKKPPVEKAVEVPHVEPVEEPSVNEQEPVAEQQLQVPAAELATQASDHVTNNVTEADVMVEKLEQQVNEKEEKTPSHHDIKEATPQQPEMIEIKSAPHQPTNSNDNDESEMIDSDLMDDETKTEEDMEDQEEMLAALNNNIIKAFDHNTSVNENAPLASNESENPAIPSEQVEQPLTQQQQLLQNLSSPLVAMDRLSALVQQEIISDESPRDGTQGLYSQHPPPPHPPRFDMGMPMHMNNRRPNMPPGLGMPPPPPPPEWMGRGGFDPFNGQDPSLVAARRLQHSQRMLEASGLFGGVPPGAAPPPPRFPFSPEFNGGPHPFSPHPPPGMFPPPMMRHGMPMMPPPPPMEEMRNEFGGMKINDQSRQDLRALLPNVNISFNHPQRRPDEIEFFQQQQQQQQQRFTPPINNDVRTEAQNFFGEFLRKAATEQSPKQEESPPKPATCLPFQDPAIMSVQQLGGQQLSPKEAAGQSQNPLLQILGGQPPPQMMPFSQNPMEQRPMEQHPPLEQNSPLEQQQKSVEQSPIHNRQADPRQMEPHQPLDFRQMSARQMEFQQMDPRQLDLGQMNARPMDPRQLDPRQMNHMQMDPRQMNHRQQMEQQMQMDPRHMDPRRLEQMQMDPRFMSMEQARAMQNGPKPFNNMFMAPPPNLQQQQQQQQPFPPPFMPGPPMGMMGHMGLPGMMRPPMPADMRFRNGPPPPPGMFPESRPNDAT